MSRDGFAGLGALMLLARLRLRGRLREALRGLRNPKKAAVMLLGLALVTLFLWASSLGDRGGGNPMFRAEHGRLLLGAFLTFFLLSTSVASIANGAMLFSPAEVGMLFPAPVSSRALIVGHVLSSSTKAFTGALAFTLFLRPGGGTAWYRVLAVYTLVFITLSALAVVIDLHHMHFTAAVRRRRALVWGLALAVSLVGTVLATRAVDGRWSAEVIRHVGLPGSVYASLLSDDAAGGSLLPRLGAALGLLALLLARALSWAGPVRPGALNTSDRVQRTLKRFRRGGPIPETARESTDGRVLPMLPRWGGAGVHVWRQLSALRRKRKAFGLLIGFSIFMAATMSLAGGEPRPALGAIMAMGMLMFMGPFYVQCDFRADLDTLPWLRSLPCSATTLAAGQILASTLVLTGLQYLLGGWGVFFAEPGQLPFWVVGLLALPVLNLVVLAVENGLFLLHPVRLDYSKGPPGASQVVRLYGAFLLKAIVLGSVLGLAALAGVGVGWAANSPLAGLIVALIALVLETAMLVVIVGRIFRSVDPGRGVAPD